MLCGQQTSVNCHKNICNNINKQLHMEMEEDGGSSIVISNFPNTITSAINNLSTRLKYIFKK